MVEIGIHFQEMFMGHPFREEKLKENEKVKEYQYGNLDTEIIGDSLLAKKGKEVFKVIDHYYL